MEKINGYIVAPFTPFNAKKELELDLLVPYCDLLVRNGIEGVFICGSTGEGFSMTTAERKLVAEKWMAIAPKDFKVIVHVGATGVADSKELARHAAEIGAWGTGANSPVFFKAPDVDTAVAYYQELAGASPELPFFIYYIPGLAPDGVSLKETLIKADGVIPNLAGVKFTDENFYLQSQCREVCGGKYEILHGQDETLHIALEMGAKGGVGGTYNHCFPVYKEIMKAYAEGNTEKCREWQLKSQDFINVLVKYRGNMMGGKRMMKFIGLDLGPNRLPLKTITAEEEVAMRQELEAIGFFEFCNK